MSRCAGVLMSITSLPSPYGIGTLGKAAYEFADFLKKAGQTCWQILPVGPTSYGDSPYQSFSTFAGNPYFIDFDLLKNEGLLLEEEYNNIPWAEHDNKVNYGAVYYYRFDVLRKAFQRFFEKTKNDNELLNKYNSFVKSNESWLDKYALFMTVKKLNNNKSWVEWDDEQIKKYDPKAVEKYLNDYKEEVEFWKFTQYLFYKQWTDLKNYVNSLGIKIIGDMPIYVAMDSADTWANSEVFWLDGEKRPVCVAGCPPDCFSESGQLWGNPLYNWDYLKETGYKWWFERIKAASELYDITRIDHFRAFDTYYAIPYPAENAIGGTWKEGPGIDFFNKMRDELGNIPIIAEDLGELFPSVIKLLEDSKLPGMKVLEFAFSGEEDNPFLPHNYTTNCVVYTGTHDNDTVAGWEKNGATKKELEYAYKYTNLKFGEPLAWGLIKTAYYSKADYCIIPVQDLLVLGSEARMNTPSTLGDNWTWRLTPNTLSDQLANDLRYLAIDSKRL